MCLPRSWDGISKLRPCRWQIAAVQQWFALACCPSWSNSKWSLVNGVASLKPKAWLRSRLCLKSELFYHFFNLHNGRFINRRQVCSQYLMSSALRRLTPIDIIFWTEVFTHRETLWDKDIRGCRSAAHELERMKCWRQLSASQPELYMPHTPEKRENDKKVSWIHRMWSVGFNSVSCLICEYMLIHICSNVF